MSFYHNPKIITDGLIYYFDAASYKSAQSGSSTWKNLVGDNDATIYTNTTYSNQGFYDVGGGSVGGGFVHSSSLFDSESSWAFSQWQNKPEGRTLTWRAFCGSNILGPGGYFYYAPTLRYYQDYYDPGTGNEYYGVMSGNPGGEFTFDVTDITGSWFNITVSYSGTTKSCSVMINGDEFVESKPVKWSPRPVDNFRFQYVGRYTANDRCFDGYIATHMAWNREISLEENKQNYIAIKGRFGK